MLHDAHLKPALAAALVASLAGCSLEGMKLPQLTQSLGGDAPTSALTTSTDPPSDVYGRIARGALKCWFGPQGSLKATHAFHARVDAPSEGGQAEIVVHTRDTDKPQHGALRAYRIIIAPTPAGSLVEAQNVRFPEALGATLTSDVKGWIEGKEGCSGVGTGGWDAKAPGEETAAAAKRNTPTNKAKAPEKK